MDEQQIAALLSKNVPAPEQAAESPAAAAPEKPQPTDGSTLLPTELDELTMFKMHDYFGEQYRGSNEQNKSRLQFIYNHIAEQIGSTDYLAVMSKISELERMIGTAHSENRIAKLYQWVGLDAVRRNAEKAMRLING